jgi:GntR family transcriptional regulator, transcriptional repressor for pyruvate dehydrogenase complex
VVEPASLPPRDAPVPDTASRIARVLMAHIVTAGLQPGDRLPPERQLMKDLGVGRSSVREAIRKLQAVGVLESRMGSGTYLVRIVSPDAIHIPLTLDVTTLRDRLLQTLDVRRGLELEASALAAERRTARDLTQLEERLVEMERVHHEKGTAGREDLAFHLAIYDSTRNPLFRQLLEQMREAFESFWHKPFDRPDFARRSFPFHRELFDAIRDGDVDRARERTLAILHVVEEDIKEMSR